MANVILGDSHVVEFKDETVFGTFPAGNPSMIWIGSIQEGEIKVDEMITKWTGLKDQAATDKTLPDGAQSLGQTLDFGFKYLAQDWTFFQWAMSNAGAGTMTDDLKSLCFQVISPTATQKFLGLSGCKVNKIDVDIPVNGSVSIDAKLIPAHIETATNNPWSATPLSTGYSTKSTTAPLKWGDISAVTWNGVDIPNTAVGGIKFGLDLKQEPVIDAYGTLSTKIGAIETGDTKDITASVVIKRKTIDALSANVIAGTAQDLVITISGTTFTFTDAIMGLDTVKLAPKGLSTVEVPFLGITSLAVT